MTETQTRPRLQGKFEWFDAKSIHIQARFDKVALHQNRLMFISLVAFSQDVKAIRAGLAAGLSSPMRLGNVTLTSGEESIVLNDAWPSGHGYRVDAHRLGLGSLHALFTCRQPGFLLNDSDDALWQELKQERFTDPLAQGPAALRPRRAGDPHSAPPPTWTLSSSPGPRTARLSDSLSGRCSGLIEVGRAM
jgi:hypothetical protein